MEEQLISFETAKLAKEKGFILDEVNTPILQIYYLSGKLEYDEDGFQPNHEEAIYAPTQSLLQKFIRETRSVHIEIHRNASGYYWSMCKADGGTDLGWSDISGPNDGGVWDSFEGALENALQVQLSYDLPNDITIIEHWGNYVEFALKSR